MLLRRIQGPSLLHRVPPCSRMIVPALIVYNDPSRCAQQALTVLTKVETNGSVKDKGDKD